MFRQLWKTLKVDVSWTDAAVMHVYQFVDGLSTNDDAAMEKLDKQEAKKRSEAEPKSKSTKKKKGKGRV